VGKKNGIHKNKTPVYIGYFTAWVDDKDEIHFYEDIYKRD
jgi:murein L,D-transpeptidase YcbB/YkuD